MIWKAPFLILAPGTYIQSFYFLLRLKALSFLGIGFPVLHFLSARIPVLKCMPGDEYRISCKVSRAIFSNSSLLGATIF